MSNALSIVAITAVLKDLLENGLVSDSITASVGDVLVTAIPPDLIKVGTDEQSSCFMLPKRSVAKCSEEKRVYSGTTDDANP